jgi:multicomponent Na+:H+ antiporter subunit B
MNAAIEVILLLFLVVVAIAALRTRDLVAGSFLLGGYSYLLCLTWTEVGAVDVALTEAAVGAGISTALLIATIHRTRRFAEPELDGTEMLRRRHRRAQLAALVAVALAGAMLLFGVAYFPVYGDATTPAATYVSDYYTERTFVDSGVPNIVTAVLADYRGYDTMFETVVIFAAGLAVATLLRRPHRSGSPRPEKPA